MTVAPLIAMKSSQVKSFDAVGREQLREDVAELLYQMSLTLHQASNSEVHQ